MQNILYVAYFAKDVEEWFGYHKLNAFLSYKCLMFVLIFNNKQTITSDINIEYVHTINRKIYLTTTSIIFI